MFVDMTHPVSAGILIESVVSCYYQFLEVVISEIGIEFRYKFRAQIQERYARKRDVVMGPRALHKRTRRAMEEILV